MTSSFNSTTRKYTIKQLFLLKFPGVTHDSALIADLNYRDFRHAFYIKP
tara:strand:+ start:2500 stop:2646 length:147 start_codon:yes stop_codon:yes gene_type:complete